MKNIILFLFTVLVVWGCTSEPDQEFSVKGVFLEDFETRKPAAYYSFSLVCRDVDSKRSDVIIPFKTNADGSFNIKGKPNFNYYFIMGGKGSTNEGVSIVAGMGPKHYDLGMILSDYRYPEGRFYPVILKYDLINSSFENGDTFRFNNSVFKYPLLDKTNKQDFNKADTVLYSNFYAIETYSDSYYLGYLFNSYPKTLGKLQPNFSLLNKMIKKSGRISELNPYEFVHYSIDKYPVVTVKIP